MPDAKDFIGDFNERTGKMVKEFSSSVPLSSDGVCRKETLGKDFPCECKKCKEENNG